MDDVLVIAKPGRGREADMADMACNYLELVYRAGRPLFPSTSARASRRVPCLSPRPVAVNGSHRQSPSRPFVVFCCGRGSSMLGSWDPWEQLAGEDGRQGGRCGIDGKACISQWQLPTYRAAWTVSDLLITDPPSHR